MNNRSTSNLSTYYKELDNFTRLLFDHLINPPMYNIIFKNKQGLLYNADIIPFNKNVWNQNPMQFCLEQYDKVHYYPIILICNNLLSIYEFTSANLENGILAPLKNTIFRILDVLPPTEMRY